MTSKIRRRWVATVVTAGIAVAGGATTPAFADFGLERSPAVTFHTPSDVDYFEATGGLDPFLPLTEDTRAGAHTDLSVDLKFNTRNDDSLGLVPDEQVRDIDVDLPAGFVGDPSNRPSCDPEKFTRTLGTGCDADSQVGAASLTTSPDASFNSVVPIFNMRSGKDDTALLGLAFGSIAVTVEVSPRTDSDYGLTAKVRGITQGAALYGTRITLWGNPSDPAHDPLRTDTNGQFGFDPDTFENVGVPTDYPDLPFITTPARCDAPLESRIRITSWQQRQRTLAYSTSMPPRTDCDALRFDASLDLSPTSRAAGQPTGMGIDLSVPQTNSMDERATPQVEDVTATLPPGVSISPGGADGLVACSDEQLAKGSRAPEACPDGSKVGTATISTPLLDEKIEGAVYLGTQKSQDPASGDMYRLFVAAYGKGVRVKLQGNVAADPKTGQLTATFKQNPELPFDNLHLQLKDGPRALLVNPMTCGTTTTGLLASSYAGTSVTKESGYTTDQGCAAGGFSPAFNAGTLDPFAGGLSPFTMTAVRHDGEQDLKNIKLELPSGLLGALGKVPVCGDAQAAAGACDASTRLGSTTVSVGTGSNPYALPGTVSLAGPYKGAPFSLSIAVPAKAGPLDLGMVVVRSPLIIDANNARVTAPVDDLPQIVGGVPLHYRSISVALNRPGFMFNATNCSPQTVVGTLTSSNGVAVRPGVRYQAQGCDKLKLTPSLKISYSGKKDLRRNGNPTLTADLGQTFGQAGLKRVRVTLPKTSTLKPDNAKALCTPEQAAARACPDASIVGRASATTPALHESLTGPVYFLKGTRKTASGKVIPTLPKLWLKLRGDGVDLDLRADSATDNKTGRLVATFVNIPDAPIADFKLVLFGGSKGILGAPPTADPCTDSRRADVQFDGQNGGRQIRSLNIAAPDCGVRASMNATASSVRVGFTGIEAGKVSVSGTGLVSKSSTVKSGDRASVTASLTPAIRRQIASGRTVKLRLTATFDPKAKGKTTKITKTVTIKGAKRRR